LRPERRAAEDAQVEIPETKYAKTADGLHIAYQVMGTGPTDLVLIFAYAGHVSPTS
jgi:hypothetical protein